jgi:hypothetical protein
MFAAFVQEWTVLDVNLQLDIISAQFFSQRTGEPNELTTPR